jgi:CheY-like chemotaxis protein
VLKVLIAEDDLMIADMVEEILIADGYAVCGIARTVAEAVALGRRHRPDLAIIDMRLAGGGLGTEVAAQLRPMGRLGVLYASGNVELVMRSAADGDACIAKPYRFPDLLRALEIVADIVRVGVGSPPFPRGFNLLPSTGAARLEAMHG